MRNFIAARVAEAKGLAIAIAADACRRGVDGSPPAWGASCGRLIFSFCSHGARPSVPRSFSQSEVKVESCGTCKYLVVSPDRDGKRRVRKSYSYQCSKPFDLPFLGAPSCIRLAELYRVAEKRDRVEASDGANCFCWERHEG